MAIPCREFPGLSRYREPYPSITRARSLLYHRLSCAFGVMVWIIIVSQN
jgi:hypothetical protein